MTLAITVVCRCRHVIQEGLAAGIAAVILVLGPWSMSAAQVTATAQTSNFTYVVPLDAASPWPKFRRDAQQSGRSPVLPTDSGSSPWVFQTGNGVFSSPVIDGDGTIYIGSADQYFYSIDRNGHARWKLMVGGIIDSAALLDDQGRVIFGAGDGRLYALERNTGKLKWTFLADPPAVNRAFIRWFEGNVAIGSDGAIYAPNDNFCTYAVARTNGQPLWCSRTWDQTWSSPAFDPASNALLIGNNFPFLRNTFALDAATGKRRWAAQAHGSVVASPLLTTAGSRRMAVAACAITSMPAPPRRAMEPSLSRVPTARSTRCVPTMAAFAGRSTPALPFARRRRSTETATSTWGPAKASCLY